MGHSPLDETPKGLINLIKYTIRESYSIPKNSTIRRALIGAFVVYCPEIPAYFIPAFTQAKETGDAKELKRGENLRGILSGALEGTAVGAIALKEKMSVKNLVPFILLGSAVQLASAMVMPRFGEKMGALLYDKNQRLIKPPGKPDNPDNPVAANVLDKTPSPLQANLGNYPKTTFSQGNYGLRI